ncbi:MAG: DUF2752 domain-containing protein [Phycisphaerae bacterium]
MPSYMHSDGGAEADSAPQSERPTQRKPFLARRLAGVLFALPTLTILFLAAMEIDVDRSYCGLKKKYGYPCPTCGMTRGFRAMAHGQVRASFGYHPFAPVLFAATAAVAAAGTVQAVTGKALLSRTRVWWWILLANGVLAGWAIKVAIGRADGTYPLG